MALTLLIGCASAYPASPRRFASAASQVEALHIGSYISGCQVVIRDEDQIRDLLVLLQEARSAVLETYQAESWFEVEWRDGPSRQFYAGHDWIAPVQTGFQDAISGWRLRSESFHAALVLAIDQECFKPRPPSEPSQQTGK